MACLYPILLPVKKKHVVGDNEYKITQGYTVPCGKCLGCYIDKTSEWALRARLEKRLHKDCCFLSLTYDEAHISSDYELVRKDYQDFLKRLRKHLEPKKIRVYGCGEYGQDPGVPGMYRPHYHMIIFGWDPEDKWKFFINEDGDQVYRSPILEKLWKNGFSTLIEVNDRTVRYCSLYLQKLRKDQISCKKVKPFMIASRRPGLGFGALTDEEIANDCVYINGKKRKLPRSFVTRLMSDDVWSDQIQFNKQRRAEKSEFFEREIIDKSVFKDPREKADFLRKALYIYSKK